MTQTPARIQPFIRGAFTASAGDGHFPDLNPSNPEDVVALVPVGASDDVARAVTAAEEALGSWRALPGPVRAEHLHKWAEVIGGRREALAQCVEKLDARDRDLLGRRCAEGATTRSTAAELGRSIDAVYKALAKIRPRYSTASREPWRARDRHDSAIPRIRRIADPGRCPVRGGKHAGTIAPTRGVVAQSAAS